MWSASRARWSVYSDLSRFGMFTSRCRTSAMLLNGSGLVQLLEKKPPSTNCQRASFIDMDTLARVLAAAVLPNAQCGCQLDPSAGVHLTEAQQAQVAIMHFARWTGIRPWEVA